MRERSAARHVSDRSRQSPSLWHFATSEGTPRHCIVVCLIVGTVLTLINQGDVIVAGEAPNLVKVGLTYVVPYLVATYGAVTAKRAVWRRTHARDAE